MKTFVKIRTITIISLVFVVLVSLSPHSYFNTVFSTNNTTHKSSSSTKEVSIEYDITPIIAALIAAVVALVGFIWGLITYKKDQNLRRKDVIFPLINEFDESEQMKIAKYLLDDKKIERHPDWKWPDNFYRKQYLPIILRNPLETKKIDDAGEYAIRESFDALLDFFAKLEYLLETDLIKPKEIMYFKYYLDKIYDEKAVEKYIRTYHFPVNIKKLQRLLQEV
jgi:hypothetical protein